MLEQVREYMARALTVINRITPQNRLAQIRTAIKFTTEAQALKVRGTSQPLKRVLNELRSAEAEVESNPRSRERLDFTELHQVQNELAQLSSNLEEIADKRKINTEDEDWLNGNETFDEAVFSAHPNEARNVSLGNRPFALARAPIVAVTAAPMDTNRLKQGGIDYNVVTGYVILHKQLVIGISSRADDLPDLKKRGVKPKTPAEKAQAILDMINKERRTNYGLVTTRAAKHGSSGIWYWAADERTINTLMAANRGKLALTSWGFAFGQ